MTQIVETKTPDKTDFSVIGCSSLVIAMIIGGVFAVLGGECTGEGKRRAQVSAGPTAVAPAQAVGLTPNVEKAPPPPPAQRPDLFGTVVEVREAETTIVIRGEKGGMESIRAGRNNLLYRDGTSDWLGLLYNINPGDDVRVVFQGDSNIAKTVYLVRRGSTKPPDAVHTYRPKEPPAPWQNVKVRIIAEYWNEEPKWIEVETHDGEKFAFYGPRISDAIYAGGKQVGLGWSEWTFNLGDDLELQEMERYRDGYTSKRIYFVTDYPKPEPGSMAAYFPGARGAAKNERPAVTLQEENEWQVVKVTTWYVEVDNGHERRTLLYGPETPVEFEGVTYRVSNLDVGDIVKIDLDGGAVRRIDVVKSVRQKQ